MNPIVEFILDFDRFTYIILVVVSSAFIFAALSVITGRSGIFLKGTPFGWVLGFLLKIVSIAMNMTDPRWLIGKGPGVPVPEIPASLPIVGSWFTGLADKYSDQVDKLNSIAYASRAMLEYLGPLAFSLGVFIVMLIVTKMWTRFRPTNSTSVNRRKKNYYDKDRSHQEVASHAQLRAEKAQLELENQQLKLQIRQLKALLGQAPDGSMPSSSPWAEYPRLPELQSKHQ